ncbi:iron ABC transporter ATP-binding protein [Oceanisphaera marina]|uniref:Iron ABC transporter ATP-binding protein n=1 Tax=Oceanisphaera marina TaxID=2017550 RepID=A0ABQ1IFY4_9GAMM|nr:ABC transporter ATP-binding protein [Oceanisphaera marina]GGB38677.1 iron ABC transporter ATP-binding protein [Oceanisphaera marina]
MSKIEQTASEQSAGLQISGLSTGYRKRHIIQQISLPTLAAGGVYSLIGPNAAGKSTLMRALAGLQAARGSVRLDGYELIGRPLADWARRVTYMPQTLPQGVSLNVLESVISALRASPMEGASSSQEVKQYAVEVLERVGIVDLALRNLGHLSGGQRQLVSLAQVLARNPRVLLLDEPISALDLKHQFRVMRLVHELARERNMIVVAVLHDLNVAARWSDGIVMLAQGQVVASGTPGEAITPDTLARVYGVQARVGQCSQGNMQVMIDDVIYG